MAEPPALEIAGLARRFSRTGTAGLAGIDLAVRRGETLALVGASGSGKTTLARLVMRLIEPDAGMIRIGGVDVTALGGERLRVVRPRFQMVFQDPLAAFNPRAGVARILADPLRLHRLVAPADIPAAVARLLAQVGLPPELAARRPAELSGGQRQRVAIARAIATRPALVVLDEPVSALDVSVRAGVLDLLKDWQAETAAAYLFIAHDLALVRAVADRMAVMEEGRIVEAGTPDAVLADPQAPATRALVAAVPRLRIGA
ncbi:ABC transporter ATP-binding protein [Labrys wisconsinensis]|uniref:Peptide/nickel transport system ATP-binding protein n=1 Tax=Labrys wisconsinensis TaxID=425677 RepID=A0ABU0JBT1_9HYPH|nr:ATP-binding cassette domain-containing protein [Labrys wisconsinensis]MDQ0471742.1 peptide/nickel transport system ATP-binding protein [Labrys wisconsinensis]